MRIIVIRLAVLALATFHMSSKMHVIVVAMTVLAIGSYHMNMKVGVIGKSLLSYRGYRK